MDTAVGALVSAAEAVMQSGKDVHSCFVGNLAALSPYLAVILVCHLLTQYTLPITSPHVYDFLGKKKYGKRALSATERSELARDARTKVVAVVTAIWMTYSAAVAIRDPSFATVQGRLYASSPLTHDAMLVAAAYFTWDVIVCVWDAEPAAYIFHGAACWFLYVCALGARSLATGEVSLQPFNQAIWTWGMLFESSTPFLHLRTALIQADAARGPLFSAAQLCFGLTFFLSRIVLGYSKAYEMFISMEAAIQAGQVHNVGLLRLCEALSILLCCLNGYWFALMVRRAVSPTAPVKDKLTAKLEALAVDTKFE